MRLTELNSDPKARVQLDAEIRGLIKPALEQEQVSINEVVFILTRILPELCDHDIVKGHLLAAYSLAKSRGTEPVLTCEDVV